MAVVFKRAIIEGFGSFQYPTELTLDRVGVNMVKGVNGSGKTTMFSALCWALYKINLKGVKNDQVVTWERMRDDEFRGTRVVVEFDSSEHSYRIARHIKFKGTTLGVKGGNSLMIFKTDLGQSFTEDDLVGEAQHKGDQQVYIDKVLGVDSTTFLNSIMFGQRMKRLVDATGDEKRKLFENLFELDFIADAKIKAKDKHDDYVADLSKLDSESSSINTIIEGIEERLEEANRLVEEFEENKTGRLIIAKTRHKSLQTEYTTIKDQHKAVKDRYAEFKLEGDYDTLETEQSALRAKISGLDDKESELKTYEKRTSRSIEEAQNKQKSLKRDLDEIETVCPTCSQDLPEDSIDLAKDSLQDQIKTEEKVELTLTKELTRRREELKVVQDQIAPLEARYAELAKQIAGYREKEKESNKLAAEVSMLQEREANKKREVEQANDRVAEIKKEQPLSVDTKKLEDSIVSKKERLIEIENNKLTLQNKKEKTLWWLQKGFGAGGLKAFVFNAMLNSLNAYTEKYAERLGFRVKFSVDLSMTSKPFTTTCYKGDTEIDYKELSGGQKQRIDICLAFAMHDLVSQTSDFSILIMDEIFEGLDDEGIEAVFDLIRIKAGDGKAVFVITHQQNIDSLNVKTLSVGVDEYENSLIL